jgi:hypothetical protein
MMRTNVRKVVCQIAVLGFVLFAPRAVFPASKRFDQLVPQDVSNYATVLHYREALNKLKKTPYSGLLEEPEVQELFRQVTAQMSEGLEEFRQATGVQPGELEDMFTGQVAVAVRQRLQLGMLMGQGAMARPPGTWLLFLADVSPKEVRAREVIDRLLQKASEDKQVTISSEQIGEHAIRHLTYQPDSEGPQAGGKRPVHMYLSLEDGILAVAAGQRTPLQQHLGLRDGADMGSLSENELYRDLQKRVDQKADYVSFQNYGSVWDGLRQMPQPMMLPFKPAALLEELGVFSVKGQITTGTIGDKGLSGDAFMRVTTPHKGIIKALVPTGRVDASPPSFIGADAALYGGVHFDTQVFWSELQRVLQQFLPVAYQQLRSQIDNPQAPIHLERELINALGNRWYIYLPEEVLPAGGAQAVNAMIATDLRQPEVLSATLEKIAGMPQAQQAIRTEQFQNTTMYMLQPMPLSALEAGASLQISLAVADGKLIVCANPGMARSVMEGARRETSPLLERGDFRRTLSHLSNHPHAFFYLNQKDVGRWVWTGLGKVLQGGQIQLPRYETISQYLSVSSSTAKWTEDGLRMKTWMPYPAVD